jgi:hypothetical protein
MLAVAHHYDELVTSAPGTYRARVYGRAQADGRWGAWLVFFPVAGGRVIATDRETTQSTFPDLSYWASGLTHAYLEGALERALALQPEAQLARDLLELERLEALASSRAEALEEAASAAEADARLAEAARERTEERLLETVADSAAVEATTHELAAEAARAEAEAAEEELRARKGTPSSPSRAGSKRQGRRRRAGRRSRRHTEEHKEE